MKKDTAIRQRLKETGVPEDMLKQYQHYLDSGNKQGQKRLLCKFRRMQNERLKSDREKLFCLDYIIAKVEKTMKLQKSE